MLRSQSKNVNGEAGGLEGELFGFPDLPGGGAVQDYEYLCVVSEGAGVVVDGEGEGSPEDTVGGGGPYGTDGVLLREISKVRLPEGALAVVGEERGPEGLVVERLVGKWLIHVEDAVQLLQGEHGAACPLAVDGGIILAAIGDFRDKCDVLRRQRYAVPALEVSYCVQGGRGIPADSLMLLPAINLRIWERGLSVFCFSRSC